MGWFPVGGSKFFWTTAAAAVSEGGQTNGPPRLLGSDWIHLSLDVIRTEFFLKNSKPVDPPAIGGTLTRYMKLPDSVVTVLFRRSQTITSVFKSSANSTHTDLAIYRVMFWSLCQSSEWIDRAKRKVWDQLSTSEPVQVTPPSRQLNHWQYVRAQWGSYRRGGRVAAVIN